MPPLPQFEGPQLQRICDVLADTSTGLTGSEIGQLLRQMDIADLSPGATKRHRLFEALNNRQRQDDCGNYIAAFIQTAMLQSGIPITTIFSNLGGKT